MAVLVAITAVPLEVFVDFLEIGECGVETEAQAECLRALGYDELRGFLIGRPLPPDWFVHLLSAEKPND